MENYEKICDIGKGTFPELLTHILYRKFRSCQQDQEEGRWENPGMEGTQLREDVREGKAAIGV